MSDRIVRGLLAESNLMVVAVTATGVAHEARRRHGLAPSSAALLGSGLCAGTLIAALQKSDTTRVNLQVECDGPVRGLFVDCDTHGRSRGYVRAKMVRFPPEPRFREAPLLGTKGYLSVLRDIDGQFYRGSVELKERDLSLDLEHYFQTSEQVDTALQLDVLSTDDDELGWVGGILVQRLPDGDADALEELRKRLRAGIVEATVRSGRSSAHQLLEAVAGAKVELLYDSEATYFCPCSKERVLRAISTLTNLDLVEMIQQDHKAEIDCDFCGAHYLISEPELQEVLDLIDARDAAAEARAKAKTDVDVN